MPVPTPVTTPFDEPMVAIAVLELLHVPPLLVVLKVEVAPLHNVRLPVILPGSGLAVSILVAVAVPQEVVTV